MLDRSKIRPWAKTAFGLQTKFDEFAKWCFEKKVPIVLIILGLITTFLLFSLLKQLFLMALFVAIGSASLLYNRFIRTSLGFELITLGTVMTGLLYGPVSAVIVGFTSLLLAELFNGSLQHKTLVSFIGIIVIGFATAIFQDSTITTAGIALTIIYDLIIVPGYMILGSNPIRTGLFLVTHLVFNIWLFTTIAPFIFRILH